jgi:hypothetical protein
MQPWCEHQKIAVTQSICLHLVPGEEGLPPLEGDPPLETPPPLAPAMRLPPLTGLPACPLPGPGWPAAHVHHTVSVPNP